MMEEIIRNHFEAQGYTVMKKGRPGQHEPDWVLTGIGAKTIPVEDKAFTETRTGFSSWWGYWREELRPLYSPSSEFREIPPHEKGWLAVIDGELREWCDIAESNRGYLVAESANKIYGRSSHTLGAEIRTALNFLVQCGRICAYSQEQIEANDPYDCLIVEVKY